MKCHTSNDEGLDYTKMWNDMREEVRSATTQQYAELIWRLIRSRSRASEIRSQHLDKQVLGISLEATKRATFLIFGRSALLQICSRRSLQTTHSRRRRAHSIGRKSSKLADQEKKWTL